MWRIWLVLIFALLFAGSCRTWFNKSVANTETVNANSAENQYANITDANEALAKGKQLLDDNDTQNAILALERAVELDPNLPEAHFQLGIAYGLMDLQTKQEGDVLPGDSENRIKTRSEKEFEKAATAYKKYLDANPKDDAAWFNLGRTYAKLLKDDQAEDAFRQAVKLKADDPDYQTEYGAILIRLAKYHEAVPVLKKAIELDPNNARAQDLLDDAEAGVKRLDYISNSNINSNKSNGNSNVNVNASVNSNTGVNGNWSHPSANIHSPVPSPTPRVTPKKGTTVDSKLKRPAL
ncbi:MAG: tetratricopeptide repeat protein [Pyrinomonadaceae bacterium]